MRIRYTIIALIMAILLLAVSAGCSQNNNPGNSKEESSVPTEEVEAATSTVSGKSGYSAGDTMPDFSVPLAGGGTFTLSEHRGQPVFINLFATWCPPCVGEMPEIDRLYGEYGDKVTFVVIDVGEDEATAQGFSDDNGYSLPFAYSEDGEPLSGYPIQFIPQSFILDSNGVITAYFDGSRDYDTFKAAIDAALGQ